MRQRPSCAAYARKHRVAAEGNMLARFDLRSNCLQRRNLSHYEESLSIKIGLPRARWVTAPGSYAATMVRQKLMHFWTEGDCSPSAHPGSASLHLAPDVARTDACMDHIRHSVGGICIGQRNAEALSNRPLF